MSSHTVSSVFNNTLSPLDYSYETTTWNMPLGEDVATHPGIDTSLTTLVPNITDDYTQSSPRSLRITIVLSVVIGAVILTTVGGNLLVVIAFSTTPKLRVYNNYFILGLAIADFVVGAVDMPIYAVIIIAKRWPFGDIFCDIFTFIDHVSSHVSVILVTLISLDRCVAVSHPLRHRLHWRRRSRAILIMAMGYAIPVIIWLPLTILWEVIHGIDQSSVLDDVCEPMYIDSVVASIIVAVIFIFIPFTITAILCIRIYNAIKVFYEGRKRMNIAFENTQSTCTGEITKGSGIQDAASSVSIKTENTEGECSDETPKRKCLQRDVGNKNGDKLHKESLKGVRTLVFIVVAMGIAWFPVIVFIITSSLCTTCDPPAGIYSVMVFWGYSNSLMNPICYALADKAFKDAFLRILTLRCFRKDTIWT